MYLLKKQANITGLDKFRNPKSNTKKSALRTRTSGFLYILYNKWDQVPMSSKLPLLTGYTRREPVVQS